MIAFDSLHGLYALLLVAGGVIGVLVLFALAAASIAALSVVIPGWLNDLPWGWISSAVIVTGIVFLIGGSRG